MYPLKTEEHVRAKGLSSLLIKKVTIKSKWDSEPSLIDVHQRKVLIILCLLFQMYPDQDIKNVVEASKKVTIDNWCKAKHSHCRHHGSHTVRPFKCLGKVWLKYAFNNIAMRP